MDIKDAAPTTIFVDMIVIIMDLIFIGRRYNTIKTRKWKALLIKYL